VQMTPCGKIVDYLRSCYEADFRFFPGDLSRVSRVRWYRPAEGAEILGFYNRFSSSVYSPPMVPATSPQIGEIVGSARVWNDGEDTLGLPGTYTCTDAVKWESGSPGPAADFDPTACCTMPTNLGTYFACSAPASMNLVSTGMPTGAAAFSIAYWGKLSTIAQVNMALYFGTTGGTKKGVHVGYNSGSFGWYAGPDGGPVASIGFPGNTSWHWLYQEYTGTQWKIYLDNGTPNATTVAENLVLTATMAIGNFTTGGFTWLGQLDDVRVYNRVLTSAERAEIYNAGHGNLNIGSAGASLLRWFNFDQYTSGVVIEKTGTGFNGTLTGSAVVLGSGLPL